jgi:integrase/recombinase XerD
MSIQKENLGLNTSTDITITNPKSLQKPIENVNRQVRTVGTIKIRNYLTKEEMYELINIIPKNKVRDKMMITFLWMTGVRVTELLNIRKKDIDFENKYCEIMWLKKRKKQVRSIPIPSLLIELLAIYCSNIKKDDLLFPITRQRVHKIIKYYLAKTSITKNIGPHSIRHSYAVHFYKQTKDLKNLQQILGHKYLSTTGIYGNMVSADVAEVVDKLEW